MEHISLKLVTWNILSESCIDFVNPAQYYSGIPIEDLKIKKRFPKIVKKIKEHDGDIVMLQEITPSVRLKLIDALPKYKVLGFAKHSNGDRRVDWYGNTTLLKECIFNNVSHKTLYLNSSGTAYSITLCKHKLTGKELLIMNVHYDAYDPKLRISETVSSIAFLKKFYKKRIIIIGGDFNTDEAKLHKKYNGYVSVIKPENAQSTYLCEAPMIDYIYVKGIKPANKDISINNERIDNTTGSKKTCMRDTLQTYGSDHHPVVGELHIL